MTISINTPIANAATDDYPRNAATVGMACGVHTRTFLRWLKALEDNEPSPIPRIAISCGAVYRNAYGHWRVIPAKLWSCCDGSWPR